MSAQIDEDQLKELVTNRKRIREENLDYYLEHQEDLREDYGGKIVAIAGANVVDSMEDTEDMEAVKAFIDRVQTEWDGAYISKVPEPGETLML